MSRYTFTDFVTDVEWRLRRLCLSVSDPDFTWPGILILDAPDGLRAEAFEIGVSVKQRDQLGVELEQSIVCAQARRFAWAMPCAREEKERQIPCLLVVFAERGRSHAAYVDLVRRADGAPRLGRFNHGPFGGSARRLSWRFVDPLFAALER